MKVSFKKKYSYAPYLNVDIEGESVCEETKESFFTALDTLNDWCNEWYRTRYGEHDEMTGTTEKIAEYSNPISELNKYDKTDYEQSKKAEIESKADVDWKEFVKQLMKLKYREDALEFVANSDYKYVPEAKSMAESLKSKQ